MSPTEQPVVFITGGAQGLGAALVNAFGMAGFQVVASSRRPPVNAQPVWLEWLSLDISQHGACDVAMDEVFRRKGRLDVVVSNASGYLRPAHLHDLTEAEISEEVSVTLLGAIHLARAFTRRAVPMGRGRIIFVASSAGLSHEQGCGSYAVYSAGKAGLIRFAETLHEDLSPLGLQSLVVVPSNMRAPEVLEELIDEQAMSYSAAAMAIVSLARTDGNLAMTRAEFRPARVRQSES